MVIPSTQPQPYLQYVQHDPALAEHQRPVPCSHKLIQQGRHKQALAAGLSAPGPHISQQLLLQVLTTTSRGPAQELLGEGVQAGSNSGTSSSLATQTCTAFIVRAWNSGSRRAQ